MVCVQGAVAAGVTEYVAHNKAEIFITSKAGPVSAAVIDLLSRIPAEAGTMEPSDAHTSL